MRKQYDVRMRRKADGGEFTKVIFADNEDAARERAPGLARRGLRDLADREYAEFEVLSCVARS